MDRAPDRYPLRNGSPAEAERLGSLQALLDSSTARNLERLGMAKGWHCAELGAGAGSVAMLMAERVGEQGSVTAIDRDTALLAELGTRPNVHVVSGDLMTMDLGRSRYDLVHSRSVLMHLEDPDRVLRRVVPALRPGAVVLFEEVDGAPLHLARARLHPLPEPFVATLGRLAGRWTWAGGLARRLEDLGFLDVRDDVSDDPLRGATAAAAFWAGTLRTVRPLITDPAHMERLGTEPVDDASLDAMLGLLDDPAFEAPFVARHQVSGRLPPGGDTEPGTR